VPKPSDQTAFSLALNEIAADGTASVTQMAHAIGCSESHMRDVVSICDTTQLSLEKAIRLSAWLVDEKGETRHLEGAEDQPGFLGRSGEVHFRPESFANDDDIRREVMDARQDAANAIEALDEGNREEAAKQIRDGIGDFHEALQDIQTPA